MGKKLRQLNPASKVSKRGVSAASVYAINEEKGLHSSRCLLTVVVHRLKGILKRVIFWFVSLLLPVDQAKHQACWEGHNLKQHYLTRKHFSAIYNAKWQTATHGKPEKMASSFLQLLTLTGVRPYLLTVLHRGHSGQKMQCRRKWINSTKLRNCQFMHVNWFFTVSQTQIHTLRIYCSATPTGFPSYHGGTQIVDFKACQVPEVSKGEIEEHLPKGWAEDLEALEHHKWSLPWAVQDGC